MNKKIHLVSLAGLILLILSDRAVHGLIFNKHQCRLAHRPVYPYRPKLLCETNQVFEDNPKDPSPQKHHTLSVCLVPPPSEKVTWVTLTNARTKLRDPGLFRWPPHVNILYPFVSVRESYTRSIIDKTFLSKLRNATQQVQPFHVSLDRMGTFGGPTRGVLWLYPRSFRETDHLSTNEEPVCELQALLEQEFPTCAEALKQREFIPHMTISQFASSEEAEAAKTEMEWMPPRSFLCEEIYLLERHGDDGQFERIATLALGAGGDGGISIHDPPLAFPAMPSVEEEWVRDERMELKARRNNQPGTRRRGRRQGRRRKPSQKAPDNRPDGIWKSKDSPEAIAQKRAERKARREHTQKWNT